MQSQSFFVRLSPLLSLIVLLLMNITYLKADNLTGLKNLLVLDASRVVSGGERPVGNNVNEGICHYTDSPATYIEGTTGSHGFSEKEIQADGVPMYEQIVSVIIPKDRPELITQFMKWRGKRFIVLTRDYNGYIKMIGTRLEPAKFLLEERIIESSLDGNNYMRISFIVTRKDPAYNYTINYQEVESNGSVLIGNRILS